MKRSAIFIVVVLLVVFGFNSSVNAYEWIKPESVQGLIGNNVYAAKSNRDMAAGETLKLTEAKPWNRKDEPLSYNFVYVENAGGKKFKVQIQYLSLTPLGYDLKTAKDPLALTLAAYKDAYEVGLRIYKLSSENNFSIGYDNPAYKEANALKEYFKFAKGLAYNMVFGSRRSKANLLRAPETKWTATASDEVVTWYSSGIPDKEKKDKLKSLNSCLGKVSNLDYHGNQIARAERDKEAKNWRRGMKDVPEEKLEALDKENFEKLDKRIADSKKKIEEEMKSIKKMHDEILKANEG